MEFRYGPQQKRELVLLLIKRSPQGLSKTDITRLLLERGIRVTDKTSKRLVESLIDAKYPIEIFTDPSRGRGQFYKLPTHYRPDLVIQLNPSEVEAVFVALGLMNPLRRTKHYAHLENLSTRLELLIPEKSRKHLAQLKNEMGFEDRAFLVNDVSEEILSEIRKSILEGLYLEADYFAAYKGKSEKKIIGPEKIFLYNGNLYLIGTDRGNPRMYVLHRFHSVKTLTDKPYKKKNLEPSELFQHSIGINSSGPLEQVKLEFEAAYTPYIRERMFHASQKLKVQENGTALLSMELVINEELANWVLSWGPQVRVIGPPLLKKMVTSSAALIAKKNT
jgi:predicted DNA-binding transcriptional regulator YafY